MDQTPSLETSMLTDQGSRMKSALGRFFKQKTLEQSSQNGILKKETIKEKKKKLANFDWRTKQDRQILYLMQQQFSFEKIKKVHIDEITDYNVNVDTKGLRRTMDDPNATSQTETSEMIESILQGIYTTEMSLKILAWGFLFGKKPYIRDPWNILDFTVVMSAYLTIVSDAVDKYNNGGKEKVVTRENKDSGGISLSSLRAFRVLRPLRAVTTIKGLQVIVKAVLSSLPLLKDTILVLLTFFVVFSIAGIQIFSGSLKNRCVHIEDGYTLDPDYLCGGRAVCPEEFFCGKQNENPNFGATNFDNLAYGLLTIFQLLTQDSWSNTLVFFMQAYSDYAYLLIIPILFIGSLFLLNLLLAVINASFTETTQLQRERDELLKANSKIIKKKSVSEEDAFGEDEIPDQIGINQYWVAKRVARKFLALLKLAKERDKLKKKSEGMFGVEEQIEEVVTIAKLTGPVKIEKKIDESESEEFSDQVLHLINSNDQIKPVKLPRRQRNGDLYLPFAVNEMMVQNKINTKLKKLKGNDRQLNVATVDKLAVKLPDIAAKQYQGEMADFEQLDGLLNLSNILQEADREDLELSSFIHPYDLSKSISQAIDYSQGDRDDKVKVQEAAAVDQVVESKKPIKKAVTEDESDNFNFSSAIRSESSFEERIKDLDFEKEDKKKLKKVEEKMQLYKETYGKPKVDKVEEVVKKKTEVTALKVDGADPNDPPVVFEEEPVRKGKKKKRRSKDQPGARYLDFKYTVNNLDKLFLDQVRSKNPYDYILKGKQKVEILNGMPYRGTSSEEIFEIRNRMAEMTMLQDATHFIKANMGLSQEQLEMEDNLLETIKPVNYAYQLKTCYRSIKNEQAEFDEDDDDALILALQPYDTVTSVGYGHLLTHRPIKFVARRSDIIVSSTLQLTLSPADSGYRPKDHAYLTVDEIYNWCHKRQEYRAMDESTAKFYEPNELQKKVTANQKTSQRVGNSENISIKSEGTIRRAKSEDQIEDHTSPIKDTTTKLESTQTRVEEFEVNDLTPQVYLIPPTLLTKPLQPEMLKKLNEEERRLYFVQKGKYDNYLRICKKKEVMGENPVNKRFTLEQIKDVMLGKHHDQEDNVEEDEEPSNYQVPMNYKGKDESFRDQKLKKFDQKKPQIVQKKHRRFTRKQHQHIPTEIIEEFDLPAELHKDSINFDEVLKKDCYTKRKTPVWSGQDVLEIGLTNDLAQSVVSRINKVRVWPKGFLGTLKKARVALKMLVKHDQFGNFLTFAVLLNTICMAMQKYNMDQETIDFLEQAGEVFTWLFICELVIRLIAVGPAKYFREKMNWLDASVVSLSIFEMLMTVVGGSGGNMSAFRTVRVLRTLRVLRAVRLLRQLKSMQLIIEVITKSAMDFFYITLLVFIFIFIYTLLGMRVFGGKLNFSDGIPRPNFDTFIVAFFTSFQIMTCQSWSESALYQYMRSESIGLYVPVVYCVSWIFIGNYILLNLFLAILLDSFMGGEEDEEPDAEQLLIIKEKQDLLKKKEKIRRLKKMGVSVDYLIKSSNNDQKKKKKDEEYLWDDVDELTLEQIREIFMDMGIIKEWPLERIERKMYEGIECENSWYIFSKKNKFRRFIVKLTKNKWYNAFIMFLIGASSIKLAVNSYLVNYSADSIQVQLSENIDILVNVLFLFECINKNIACGTLLDEGSYLRDNWNRLDLFIVATSMIDMSLANVDIPALKVLRLLRTLRPLRVISNNRAMKQIISALFDSVGSLSNVVLVVICAWGMFAIFAVNIFAGKLFYCDIAPYLYSDKYTCNKQGGSWVRYDQNFDDFIISMQTLFILGTNDFTTVMYQLFDAVDVDKGPKINHANHNGLFNLAFMFIGQLFFMNFFVGILFLQYTQSAKQETKGYSKENLTWIDIQRMIVEQKCPHDLMNKPDYQKHPNRYKYWRIVQSKPFDLFIITIIVLNIVQMGIQFEGSSALFNQLLDITNYIFSFIFAVEMYLKIRAYNLRYWDTFQHKFDSFIVASSVIDIVMGFAFDGNNSNLSLGPQIARMMRVMRVTRVVRLAGKNEGLQALMSTITLSIGALANVFLLLLLALFIFAVLGNFFFSEVTQGPNVDEFRNFSDFGKSYLFMFILGTGEYLDGVMFDFQYTLPGCIEGKSCGSSYSSFFFIMITLFIQNVMLNLFVLVIIQQFETYYMAVDNPITKFKKNLEVFMVTWVEFTATKYRCLRLREKKLKDFFKRLPAPIGLPLDTTDEQMKKIMLRMCIKCPDGYVYFNELLYRCMRRQFGNFKLNKKMMLIELKTQYTLFMIKLSVQSSSPFSLTQQIPPHEIFFENVFGLQKSMNPFLQEMYFNITFNTWLSYSRKMQKRERFEMKQEVKKQKMWSQGLEYQPDELVEAKPNYKYVQIDVEEILVFTSEGEKSSSEDEIPEVPPKLLQKKTLLKKKNIRPEGGLHPDKLRSAAFKTITSKKTGYKILDLFKDRTVSENQFKISGEQVHVQKLAEIKAAKKALQSRSLLNQELKYRKQEGDSSVNARSVINQRNQGEFLLDQIIDKRDRSNEFVPTTFHDEDRVDTYSQILTRKSGNFE